MRYFTCKPGHGLFVPLDKVTAAAPRPFTVTEATSRLLTQLAGAPAEAPAPRRPPVTPVKNMLHPFVALPPAIGSTPGTTALSRELFKRQEEVNIIRRQVEPLLLTARKMAAATGLHTPEHLGSVVARLSGSMHEYDKVVGRYERQLQKLIEHMERRRAQREQEHESAGAPAAEEARRQLASADTQYRLLKKEYEQVQRSVAARAQLVADLEADNAQLRGELERLRLPAPGPSGEALRAQIDALSQALEATKEENLALRRERDLARAPAATLTAAVGTDAHAPDRQVEEVLQAKDRQEAYYQDVVGGLRADLEQARALHKAALASSRAEADALRAQLADQEARTHKYRDTMDSSNERYYAENRTLQQAHAEEAARLQAELGEATRKLAEAVQALEHMAADKQDRARELAETQHKLVELSSALAREQQRPAAADPRADDASKQIRVLEQTILDMQEAQQRSRDAARPPGAAAPAGSAADLQRQLAQVEYEKAQIERTLEEHLAAHRTGAAAAGGAARPGRPADTQRAQQIKKELVSLQPAIPRLAEKLRALLRPSAAPVPSFEEPVAEVKAALQQLEATRQHALTLAQSLVAGPADDGPGLDRTPTMNRRLSGPFPDAQPRRLF